MVYKKDQKDLRYGGTDCVNYLSVYRIPGDGQGVDTYACISNSVSFCGFYYGTLYHILYLDAFFEAVADKNMGVRRSIFDNRVNSLLSDI